MAVTITYEDSESQHLSDPEMQGLSSQWIEAILGRQDISANGRIEELENVVDTLTDRPASGDAGICNKLLAAFITDETSMGRDHVPADLPGKIIEDKYSIKNPRITLDRSSPRDCRPSECLTVATLTETAHELRLCRPRKIT